MIYWKIYEAENWHLCHPAGRCAKQALKLKHAWTYATMYNMYGLAFIFKIFYWKTYYPDPKPIRHINGPKSVGKYS